MTSPKSVMILGSMPDHLAPTLRKLADEGVSLHRIDGPYRLIAAFAAEPAEVAVIDLAGLRQQDLQMIKVMREIDGDVGLVVLTDRDQRDLAANALCGGADLYLLKPVQGPEFIAALERAAARRRAARATDEEPRGSHAVYQLAQGIAHEINNPLTTISGWLQVLAADHAGNEQLSEVMGSMKEEVDRIAEVVRQLLVFAQQGPPRKAPVDMGHLIAELGRLYAARCEEKGATLVTEIDESLPPVRGDESQLRRAFDTILADAETGLDGAGRIDLSCHMSNNGMEVSIRDNGPLLSQETLARIFDPFHDGRGGAGHGMGLGLSKGIIQGHGGKLEVVSSGAEGTCFTAWLPATT